MAFLLLGLVKILYLDALVHDIPVSNCAIRSNAWDSTLIAKVIKKDTISPGVFDKLQVSSFLFFSNSVFLLCSFDVWSLFLEIAQKTVISWHNNACSCTDYSFKFGNLHTCSFEVGTPSFLSCTVLLILLHRCVASVGRNFFLGAMCVAQFLCLCSVAYMYSRIVYPSILL